MNHLAQAAAAAASPTHRLGVHQPVRGNEDTYSAGRRSGPAHCRAGPCLWYNLPSSKFPGGGLIRSIGRLFMRRIIAHRLGSQGPILLAALAFVVLFCLPAAVSAWKGPGNPLDPIEREVVNLVNAERESRGIPTLIVNYQLQEAAWKHSEHMARNKVLCHSGCGDGDPASRIRATGYKAATWGENVASGQRTSTQVMNAWMNSSGHRRNILNPDFTDIGVAYAVGGLYGNSWTQVFGRPASGFATVTPPPGGEAEETPPACGSAYDFNEDCVVDEADLAEIEARFLAVPGDPRWDAKYDLIPDDEINIYDINEVVLAMGGGA